MLWRGGVSCPVSAAWHSCVAAHWQHIGQSTTATNKHIRMCAAVNEKSKMWLRNVKLQILPLYVTVFEVNTILIILTKWFITLCLINLTFNVNCLQTYRVNSNEEWNFVTWCKHRNICLYTSMVNMWHYQTV